MKTSYVYEWLDNLINYGLNPAFIHPFPMNDEAAALISGNLAEEKQRLKTDLQFQFFSRKEETEMTLLIRKYYDALVVLINKAWAFRHHERAAAGNLTGVLDNALQTLEELLAFFQTNYTKYLTPEQELPVTHAQELRGEILEKKELIQKKLHEAGNSEEVTSVVTGALDDFVARIENGESITKREAAYHQALVKDIEDNKGQHTALSNCPSLHELLVYWNLNSKACIRYFTLGLDNIIKSNETVEEQLEFMRFQLKNISQLPQVPDFIYNPAYPSLKDYFTDYLSNEIDYLENKKIGFVPNVAYDAARDQRPPFKVLSTLSTDQMGIILKAGHDLGILISKSLSSLFQNIVPFISTKHKDELSWQSMRSKSGSAEDRDKEIAIETLQQLIAKIRES
jgi:hypothetical protein